MTATDPRPPVTVLNHIVTNCDGLEVAVIGASEAHLAAFVDQFSQWPLALHAADEPELP